MLRMSYKAKKDELKKQWSGTAIIPMEYFPPGIGSGMMNAYAIHGSGLNRTYESLYPAPKNATAPDLWVQTLRTIITYFCIYFNSK